ncbi:glycoside hydrolase family 32 protein [Pasteurellaceae bacterium TAE3-ERU1]|nr:glycoside hydrolase family 32 protein [Pasteurellaceae bacterium TAE3-ERU1]
MHVFNQGKYRSLHAAKCGELSALRAQRDVDFRPHFHIAPPTGLLNDPNGLVFDGEQYHIFYQWYPFGALHGMKHWAHLTTQDFHHYQRATPLIPDEVFESHGCYSGGALRTAEGLALFYTGNTRQGAENVRVPYQNLALMDSAGNIGKRSLIAGSPTGYSEHFRDPKPFVAGDGRVYFVCGAQREDKTGTALLYVMDDIHAQPHLLGELALHGFDNRDVFMWECPDLTQCDGCDLFLFSPQGKAQQATTLQNNYHALYALGTRKGLDFHADAIGEIDHGFDFYAPQTVNQAQRCIMLAWCGLPDLTYPTDTYGWHSMLTLPRELVLRAGKLCQRVLSEIHAKCESAVRVTLGERQTIAHLDCCRLRAACDGKPFDWTLFDNPQGQCLRLSYDGNMLHLDRTLSEQTDTMRQWGSVRQCEVGELRSLEIFIDHSIIEIFINEGAHSMTSRFFMPAREPVLTSSRVMEAEVAKVRCDEVSE